MYFSPPLLTVAFEVHRNCSQADSPLETTKCFEQLEASGLTGEDTEYRHNWVLNISEHTAVPVSGDPEAAPRQSVTALVQLSQMKLKKMRNYAMSEIQSLLSLAQDCPPGTESRQNGERPDSSSVGHWVLHALKAFSSPYL